MLAQLDDKKNMSPVDFMKNHPALYHSAIVHFGSLKEAFRKVGIEYRFKEKRDWKNKITTFLGQLPDTVIAIIVNVSVDTIRRMRVKLGIPKYSRRRMLEDLEE